MPFELEHMLTSTPLELTTQNEGDDIVFRVAHSGTFEVLYPGTLRRYVKATVTRRYRLDEHAEEPQLPSSIDGEVRRQPIRNTSRPHSGVTAVEESLDVTLTILAPDGTPFTADEVTLADLRKHRDARGIPTGTWSYTLGGEGRYRPFDAVHETIVANPGSMMLWIAETVRSESAPPLLTNTVLDASRQTFRFDLFRVGTFVAEITTADEWMGTMRLVDPDGVAVASTGSETLRHEVDLVAIGKSRDREGRLREWSLQVSPQGGVVVGSPMVSATVYGGGRITTESLRRRILKLIGKDGEFIKLFGKHEGGLAKGKIKITDPAAAEALDMHKLLEKRLKADLNPPPLDVTNVNANEEYTLYEKDEDLGYGVRLDVSTLNVDAIRVAVGGAKRLDPAIPALNVQIDVSGEARLLYPDVALGIDVTLGTAKVPDGRVEVEVGITLGPDGTPELVTWVPDDPFDIDIQAGVVAALAFIPIIGTTAAATVVALTEYVEDIFKEKAKNEARAIFADPDLAPTLLMTILGAHLTYTAIRLDVDDIVFEYIAPLEPEPKPRPDYVGVIGRRIEPLGTGTTRLVPQSLGDTWAADNLKAKIEHIVVVMMENRSYDHVLGYRSLAPINESSDGLTPDLIAAIQDAEPGAHHPDPNPDYPVRNLADGGFPPNEVGKMTRLPKGVGHSYKDVAQQLSERDRTSDGREINGAKGFVDNFTKRAADKPDTLEDESLGVLATDVLGYYDADQLPMYDFLARNFGYLDRFFCSHPGPTLPNRMFSLTGDLQYDRLGVPILENNKGDKVILSRAESIFDRLTKLGVSWRVYESEPSVTMLRMFARYATNNTEIVPISNLKDDALNRRLPAFTFVEPAMHHHPPNDDHPPADMWRGQRFVQEVYQWLSDAPTWEKTLLIITYDEHGGFYDHVVPPIADLLEPGRETGGVIGVTGTVSDGEGTSQPEDGSTGTGGGGGWRGRWREDRPFDDDDEPLVADEHEQPPPPPPADRIEIPYGVRVPTFLISPWVPAGRLSADGMAIDFCSILKTVLARFAGDDRRLLSDRVQDSLSLEPFLSEASPRYVSEQPPAIQELSIEVARVAPDTSAIDTPQLSRRQLREEAADSHEIMGFVARMLGR